MALMDDSSSQYLESQVMTATPQKLRLLLIEGAIRYARQTLELWELQQPELAVESLIRCRAVIRELLSGIHIEHSDLTRKVAAVYLFLLKCLTEAHMTRDREPVLDTIRVLEVERETWRLVCEKMPHAPVPTEEFVGTLAAPVEIVAPSEGIGGPSRSEFSFDA
jgi:flagellar protein FliS